MALPRLPSYQKSLGGGSPRATAGFRMPGSFRRMTTVALSVDTAGSGNDGGSIEQALNTARYRECGNPGPGAYNFADGGGGGGGGGSTAPMWSMGRKTWVERKVPGAKQSMEKTWFCSSDPWRQKVDGLFREDCWPEPATYRLRSLGESDPTRPSPPGFQFTSRAGFDPELRRRLECPPPGAYEVHGGCCDSHRCRIGCRRATCLWPALQDTPGPGRYDNERTTGLAARARGRRFTMRGPKERIDYSRARLGPFCAF